MIIDSLENAHLYEGLHERFPAAFAFIRSLNLSTLEVGKYEIDGRNIHAAVSEKEGVAESDAKFEAHDQYIDIQVCPAGRETLGWRPRKECTQVKVPYNEEKDVTFFSDRPSTYFDLHEGHFAIFYPGDVHAPMIGEGPIKKLVIKIKS